MDNSIAVKMLGIISGLSKEIKGLSEKTELLIELQEQNNKVQVETLTFFTALSEEEKGEESSAGMEYLKTLQEDGFNPNGG